MFGPHRATGSSARTRTSRSTVCSARACLRVTVFATTPFLAAFLVATLFATALVAGSFLAVAFPEGALVPAAFLAAAVLVVDFAAAAAFRVEGFLPAPWFLTAAFVVVAFLAADFFAADFFAIGLLAVAFLTVDFLAGAFSATVFLAVAFFAAVFLAAIFLTDDALRVADFSTGVEPVVGVRPVARSAPRFLTGVPERAAPVDFARDSAPDRLVPRVDLPLLERFFATPAVPRSCVRFRWIFGMKVTVVAGCVNVQNDIR